jgi:serine phosphatase RsbU (regulator of sigma subunit)
MTRVSVREAERNLSEALQRSLLTQPPGSGDLQVAVRYQPAAEQAQVGGDWYDAFLLPDGALTMVVGDVAGHDQEAAASMGQLRNLVRGVAYSLQESPAGVLRGLDHAMDGLGVGVIATAVLAQVHERRPAGRGSVTLCWSNAGHPPPVLIGADGRARLLDTVPDLLLGLDHVTERSDHEVTLGPGDSLLIYTDGLVERRGVSLETSLEWLVDAVDGFHELDPEELCNHLLGLIEGKAEDDIALLVVRSNVA